MADTRRRIQSRSAALMTADETRTLVNVMNSCSEALWDKLTLQQILDVYHLAQDADYYDIEGWLTGDPTTARLAYLAVRDGHQSQR